MSYPNKVVERATKVANLLKENGFFEDEELNPESIDVLCWLDKLGVPVVERKFQNRIWGGL